MVSTSREVGLILRGEDKGVKDLLRGVAKTSINLNKEIAQTAAGFESIGDSIPEKALKNFGKTSHNVVGSVGKLNRSMRGVSSNYSGFIDKTEKANSILEASDNLFVKAGANILGYGKSLDTISAGLQPAAGFWQQYSRASSGAGKALVVVKSAGQALNPVLDRTSAIALEGSERFRQMGGVLGALADPLEALSKNMTKTQKGLKLAGFASDINQTLEGLKEFKDETLPEIQEQLEETLETLNKMGVKDMLFGDKMKTLNTTATVLSATTKGATKNLSDLTLKGLKFVEISGYVSLVAGSMKEVYNISKDTYRSLEEFESLGLDTSAQKAALSIGVMGEKLLFSAEAAKQFRQQASSAFVGFQDQLAYLTTLSSAAQIGQDGLGESIQNLVNGPLKNAISSMDVAVGYYDAISAGQSSIEFMNAAMKFSAATGASAADSIGALAQVHNIYRLNARDATKTAALFNSTIENGVINGAEMAAGIGQLASVGKSAGISIEELNSMVAALTKNGFSAADAFQGLMSLITSIAGQGAESAKAAQELGVRFDFARIKAEGLMNPINELYAATKGSDAKIKTIVPDALAFRTAIALATNASKDFVDVQNQMQNLDTKSLDIVFERRQDSILQRTQAIRRGFEEEMIAFGQDFQQILTPAISAAEMLLEKFQNLSSPVRNFILLITKAHIPLEKTGQILGVVRNMAVNLAKAFVLVRATTLAFGAVMGGAARAQLATIVDLVKNQKDYIGALKLFAGVSDGTIERIKKLTSAEQAQLKTNKKLLQQRQQSVKALQQGLAKEGGVDLFQQTPQQVNDSIKKSFATATPAIKEQVSNLRSQITRELTDFRTTGTKSNILYRQLGLDRMKETEAAYRDALTKISRLRAKGFDNLGPTEAAAYNQNLQMIEDNIKRRQELLSLSRSQLALEKQGVNALNQQIASATTAVQGSIEQGNQLLRQTIIGKTKAINTIRNVTQEQLTLINQDIANQISQLSPRFASVLAGKTGAELDRALAAIRRNVTDTQIEQLSQTVDAKNQLSQAAKQQISDIQAENNALKQVVTGRKMDLASRQKAIALINTEIAARQANIAQLVKNNEIDFYKTIVDDDALKRQITQSFVGAEQVVQQQMAHLSKKIKTTATKIFSNSNALGLADAIGLTDAKNTFKDLDGVAQKLEQVKQAGTVDPRTIALVEANLRQRQELLAATEAQIIAERTHTASLNAETAALEANNLTRAQQIGFIGPLAEANTKLMEVMYNLSDSWATATANLNGATVATKLSTVWDKIKLASTLGVKGAVDLLNASMSFTWKLLGGIGFGLIGLVGAFIAFGKVRDHIKMLDETKQGLRNLLAQSEDFQQQLTLSGTMKDLAADLREYSQEVKTAAVDAVIAGEGVAEAKGKLDKINDLNAEFIAKTSKEYDTIRKLSLDEFANSLDKASASIVEYSKNADTAFDGTTVANMIDQGQLSIEMLQELAADARLAGEAVETIRLDKLVERIETTTNSAAIIQQKFEASLDKEEFKRYKKRKAKLEKERQQYDIKAITSRMTFVEKFFGLNYAKDAKNLKTEIGDLIKEVTDETVKQADEIREQVLRMNGGELLSVAIKPSEAVMEQKKQELDFVKDTIKEKVQAIADAEKTIATSSSRSLVQQSEGVIRQLRKDLVDLSGDRTLLEEQYNSLIQLQGKLSRSEELIQAAKANGKTAALSADAFKELLEVEKEAISMASKRTDLDIQAKQKELDDLVKNTKISKEEQAQKQLAIDKLKEENTLREEAFKLQEQRLKNIQAAASAIDLNNAAASTQALFEGINNSRLKVISDTLDATTKATKGYKDFVKKAEEDTSGILEIPAEYRTASLAYFDKTAANLTSTMNTTTSYQRRQLAIAVNGLAELATNVENVADKGLEASQTAVDKAIENVKILQAAGAITPDGATRMYEQIEGLVSRIKELGAEGSINLPSVIDEIFDGKLASTEEAVNRLIEINKRGIEEVSYLESLALLDDKEAQEQKLHLEVKNNKLIYDAARERYQKLATERGTDTKETLAAYGDMIAAERSLGVSRFQDKQFGRIRKLEQATEDLNNEVQKVVLSYSEELDRLQLISDELERQEGLIGVYNQGLIESLNFLGEINKNITDTVKDERYLAEIRTRTAERNLKILELQQEQEKAAVERQFEKNKLKSQEALINNDIAIAEKEREIAETQANFEKEKLSRKLRDSEVEAHNIKMANLQRERSQLDVTESKIIKNFQTEEKITQQNLNQLELKQEQAKSGGVLDVIEGKLSKITANYQAQEKVLQANSSSYENRVSYVERMLGFVGQVTKDEKEQQRLAQITAQTKLKTLQKQQEMERATLEIQQKQSLNLLDQERIKLRILKAQEESAMVEDAKKLKQAQDQGNQEDIDFYAGVINSRAEILGSIEASDQALKQQIATQRQLNSLEKEGLDYKQKADTYEARIAVNQTRPEGKLKDEETKRLKREFLREIGLNTSSLKQNTFTAPTAKIPESLTLTVPKDINFDRIIGDSVSEFLSGLGLPNILNTDSSLSRELELAKSKYFGDDRKTGTLFDFSDPNINNDFIRNFSTTPSNVPTIPINPNAMIKPPEAIDSSLSNSQDMAQQINAQVTAIDNLIQNLKNQKKTSVEMFNEINIQVTDSSSSAQAVEDVILDKLDGILSQVEVKVS